MGAIGEFVDIIGYVLYAVIGVASWFTKLLWDQSKEVKEEVEKLKLNLAENYTKKEDFKEFVSDIRQDLRETITPLCEKINKIDDYLREHPKH